MTLSLHEIVMIIFGLAVAFLVLYIKLVIIREVFCKKKDK